MPTVNRDEWRNSWNSVAGALTGFNCALSAFNRASGVSRVSMGYQEIKEI